MESPRCLEQAQMPRYFSPHDVCFRVTSPPKSKRLGEIGRQVAVLESGRYSIVFADKVRRAFGPTSLESVAMPSAPPAPRAEIRRGTRRNGACADARPCVRPIGGRGAEHRSPSAPRVSRAQSGPRSPGFVAVSEERRAPRMAEMETSEDERPLTDEEEYERALENVAVAFSEFLYRALRTGRGQGRGVVRALSSISQQLAERGESSDSDPEQFS